MEAQKIINCSDVNDSWQQIEADLKADQGMLNYEALINQDGKTIKLYIDIDLGGGFEGGSEITQLSAPLTLATPFRFALHDEDFLDSIGKFLGMDDLHTGYPEFDKHVIIKTNYETRLRELFANPELRSVFTNLKDFDFGIHTHTPEGSDEEQPYLELNVNLGLTAPELLKPVYMAFCQVLAELEK
ncbi:hypothetical protein [uncultured Mucilaginibacter sp.]|uniref:hypothetical protein n=1 Tax=uncultured Mucilaginibacter sp. TaxID=797541 RepID=UPI0025D7B740|nr:hypothetical protein [uncultured Mucilaginibacter sp.]